MKGKWILCAALMAGLLCGCGAKEAEEPPVQEEPGAIEPVTAGSAQELLDKLTTQEKVGQLFLVQPGSQGEVPVGGYLFTDQEIQTPDQLGQDMDELNNAARVPLLFCTQEEGGAASLFAQKEGFSVPQVSDMATLGSQGDPAQVKEACAEIGSALRDLGFQLNLAPTADVGTAAAFGENPEQAAMFISAAVEGYHQGGVGCALKHFPGLGAGTTTGATWQEMLTAEMYPFQAGMASGADVVMVSPIFTPKATQDGLPACLSAEWITGKLRSELRFQRVILAGPLSDEGVTGAASAGQAALMALEAGADLLLLPEDPTAAYEAVLAAVQDGTISQAQLDQSVLRVLQLKENYGLI